MSNEQVPNLRGGIGTTVMFVVALVSPIASIAGILWKAAQYPDRNEFRSATNDLASVKQDVAVQKYRQDGMDRDISSIKETTGKILDELRNGKRR
jgi:hypothetical protein